MIIAKNDEEKRSKVWRIATTTATVVIIVVAVYFLFTLFAGNPLKGTWSSEDGNLQLTIRKGNSATVSWEEISEVSNVKAKIDYVMNKESKTITFKVDDEELTKIAEASDEGLTKEALYAEISVLENTFDYSLENDELILAEREYGEQIVFVRR